MSPTRRVSFWVTLLLACFVGALLVAASRLPEAARGFPLGVSLLTLGLLVVVLVGELRPNVRALFEVAWDGGDSAASPLLAEVPWKLVGVVFGSLLAYALAVLLVGFMAATPLYILLFLRLYGGAGWLGSTALAAGTTAGMLALSRVLRADLFPGLVGGANVPPF